HHGIARTNRCRRRIAAGLELLADRPRHLGCRIGNHGHRLACRASASSSQAVLGAVDAATLALRALTQPAVFSSLGASGGSRDGCCSSIESEGRAAITSTFTTRLDAVKPPDVRAANR